MLIRDCIMNTFTQMTESIKWNQLTKDCFICLNRCIVENKVIATPNKISPDNQ
jgi:hypothetical protein